MATEPLIRHSLDSVDENESFEHACERWTRWITLSMAEWFGESWAKPIYPRKFDGAAGLANWNDDVPVECEVGEGYCLGQPGAQVAVDHGKTYWMDREERTEGDRFFRIAEGTLRCGAFPAPDDGLNVFRICATPIPGRASGQPGVSIKGWWNLPVKAHETALRILEEVS